MTPRCHDRHTPTLKGGVSVSSTDLSTTPRSDMDPEVEARIYPTWLTQTYTISADRYLEQ